MKRPATTTPVLLWWRIGDDGEDVPSINIEYAPLRAEIFDHFGVESVDELSETALSSYQRQHCQTVRLGVVIGTGDDATYQPERERLAGVEDIDSALAAHLIDWFTDIPSLCEELRRDQYLSAFYNDVRVEQGADGDWVDDLDAGPALERRLKRAGVWVEPETVAAGGE